MILGFLQLQPLVSGSWIGFPGSDDDGFLIAMVVFLVRSVAFPALVIGLFSLFRPLRTARVRAIILVCLWSFCTVGNLIQLTRALTSTRDRAVRVNVPNPFSRRPVVLPSAVPNPTEQTLATSLETNRPRQVVSGDNVDFSPGSHERLIQEIEKAQEKRYREVAEAYRRACAANPDDAQLALEWVRFTQRFAYSEDSEIESAEKDYEAAQAHLVERFRNAPGTVLFELEQLHGEDFEARAESQMQRLGEWPRQDVANFMLMRARRAQREESKRAGEFAEVSFRNSASAEAALYWARTLIQSERMEDAAKVLRHEVFASALPWQRKEQMDLLFDAGAGPEAMAPLLNDFELVDRLTKAGRIDLARSVLEAIPVHEWNRAVATERRFDFELAHGDAATADQAYREWCGSGSEVDRFARHRVALALKHPGLEWNSDDWIGLVALLLLLGFLALTPLILLVPVHYISLLRARRGKHPEWTLTPWGLRSVWAVTGLALVVQVGFFWWWRPQEFLSWFGGEMPRNEEFPADGVLISQTILWGVLTVLALGLLASGRQWRLLGTQRLSVPACVGLGVGLALGLRLLLSIYLQIVPLNDLAGQPAALQTSALFQTLLERLGPLGFVAVLAGFVPLLEEVLFRGVALGALARHLPFGWANLIQAVGFACAHEVWGLVPFFILFGLVTGWLTRRAGGLLPAIILHSTNNLIVALWVMVAFNQL